MADETAAERFDRLQPIYQERNLHVCSAYGVEAAVKVIRDRYAEQRRPMPKWLDKQLTSIEDRIVPIRQELIAHRAEVELDVDEMSRRVHESNQRALAR